MNSPSIVAAGVDDVADVAPHRTLVARQQVGLLAGHHPLPAVAHRGPALQLIRLALLLWSGCSTHLLRRLRASAGRHRAGPPARGVCGLAALRRRAALWRSAVRAARSPSIRCRLGLLRSAVFVPSAAQQFHAARLLRRAGPPACASRSPALPCWDDGARSGRAALRAPDLTVSATA